MTRLVPENQLFLPGELAVIQDAALWPTFHAGAVKVESLLLALQTRLLAHPADYPSFLPPASGRITRGSNYQGHPYRVLDLPAHLSGEDIFLFRTVVLWGHSFSFHLILSGKWKAGLTPAIPDLGAKFPNWFYSLEKTPWEWLPNAPDTYALSDLDPLASARLEAHPFMKFSRHYPLPALPYLPEKGHDHWQAWHACFLQTGYQGS